jgi:hypothetical protein
VTRRSRAVSDPEAHQHQDPHTDQKPDEALAHRTDPTEADTTGVGRVLDDTVDVGGDVKGLGIGDVALAEAIWGGVAR